jgi:hypothetical protein
MVTAVLVVTVEVVIVKFVEVAPTEIVATDGG